MATPAVSQTLSWRAGDPARLTINVTDEAGDPVPLTGSTWTVQVRGDREKSVLATMETDATDAATGTLVFTLTGAQTRTIRESAANVYGDVEGSAHGTLLEFKASVSRDVTRVPSDDDITEPTGGLGDVLDLALTNTTVTVVAQSVVAFSGGGSGDGSDDQTATEVAFTPTGTVEATDVQAAVAEVSGDVTAEAATRAAADSALSDLIATEQTVRAAADTALDGRLDTIEADYLQAADIADMETTAGAQAKAAAAEAAANAYTDDEIAALSSTYVAQSTLDANTLLGATVDNTPIAFPVAASRIVGRKATGDIDDLTTAELAALFGTPTGSKFLADDGTLKTPAGGGSLPVGGVAGQGLVKISAADGDVKWGSPRALRELLGDGLVATFPWFMSVSNTAVLTSGRLAIWGLALPEGLTVTSISFLSGSTGAMSGATNQWFALLDSSRNALRFTADDGSTAWGTNTAKTLNLTSPFVTTYTGLHYIGCMVAATSPPSLRTIANGVVSYSNQTDTGLTSPPSLPWAPSSLASASALAYGYVS